MKQVAYFKDIPINSRFITKNTLFQKISAEQVRDVQTNRVYFFDETDLLIILFQNEE